MLEQSSEQVRICRSHAYDARLKAEGTADPALKADLLAMEERWLTLARSYEFSESLDAFTAFHQDWRRQFDQAARPDAEPTDDVRLHEISTLLIQEGDLDALYGRIVDAAIGLLRSDCSSMQVYHPERNELRLLAWRGFHPESAAYWHWVSLDHHSTCAAALSAGSRVMVPDLETCAEMAGTRDLDEYRRSGIRSVQSTPLLSRSGDLIGMISTHWREAHLPSERALRRLDVLARQAADLIERSKVEARLRDSEQKNRWFASIVNLTDDAIISTDLEGRILSWNRGAEKAFGYTADEVVGGPSTFLVPPELSDEYRNVIERIRAGEPFVRYETIRVCKNGSRIAASLTVSPVKDANDKTVGLSAIVRDVTEQRRQEDQISILAREAEHRTANVLSAVQAAISLTHADSAENFKQAVAGRVQALANVHRLFVESRWTGADLLELTAQELAPFCDDSGVRVCLDGPKISVRPCIAQGIAVILHELATNAAKYGSLSLPDGRLVVNWSVADGRVLMRWVESKGPAVCRPERSGFGMRVLEKVTGSLLQGEFRLDWRTEGLTFELKFCA